MIPTGIIEDDGRTLVLRRTFAAPVADVWASLTESARLARWFGTWTGNPADGFVMVTMNAEAEAGAPTRFTIDACEPPRLLAVHSSDDYGTWRLSADLTEHEGRTTLVFRQTDIDLGMVPDTGPGWEWYLDRLVAAMGGTEPPTLGAFETEYLTMAASYRELAQEHEDQQ